MIKTYTWLELVQNYTDSNKPKIIMEKLLCPAKNFAGELENSISEIGKELRGLINEEPKRILSMLKRVIYINRMELMVKLSIVYF
jgi:hypothetical protein